MRNQQPVFILPPLHRRQKNIAIGTRTPCMTMIMMIMMMLCSFFTSSSSFALTTPSTTSSMFYKKTTRTTKDPLQYLPPSNSFLPSASPYSISLQLGLSTIDPIMDNISTIFSTTSIVPLLPSFLINSILFTTLKSKLDKMLTIEGFFHALALGTLLWHTLGWRGWTTCVLYLFLGQLVTKVKFREKEAKGIAEGRGGRRGPENVW